MTVYIVIPSHISSARDRATHLGSQQELAAQGELPEFSSICSLQILFPSSICLLCLMFCLYPESTRRLEFTGYDAFCMELVVCFCVNSGKGAISLPQRHCRELCWLKSPHMALWKLPLQLGFSWHDCSAMCYIYVVLLQTLRLWDSNEIHGNRELESSLESPYL